MELFTYSGMLQVLFERRSQKGPNMQTSVRRQQLGEALITAAERAIEARGLGGLKARELAQEVGCAVGAIYNVFPDLDALVLHANLRTLASFEAVIAASAPPAGREQS